MTRMLGKKRISELNVFDPCSKRFVSCRRAQTSELGPQGQIPSPALLAGEGVLSNAGAGLVCRRQLALCNSWSSSVLCRTFGLAGPSALGVVLLVATLNPVATQARQVEPTREYVGVVSRGVDGDTIVVGKGRKAIHVRLRCVDTPEIAHGEGRDELYGREATAFTRAALDGKPVRLLYHRREPFDHYGRLLAYVFLDDGTLFNAELVRQGLARVTRFKCLYRKQVKALEAGAKGQRRGLWSRRR